MTIKGRALLQLFSAVAAAALLCCSGSPGSAQTAAPAKPAAARQSTATAPKPAAAVKRPAPANPAPSPVQSDYWSVNTDLGSRYGGAPARATERVRDTGRVPEQTSEFGRVPLQTGPGSFGLTTTTQAKAGEFHDGRTVPGLESGARKASDGYVGLSLSVPSLDKNMALPPTPWNRNE
jgi:hypothetical protein